MSGGRYYVNKYYTQNLGEVVTGGQLPNKIMLFKVADEIFHGLTKISPIGLIIDEVAKEILDSANAHYTYAGKAFPWVTTVYICQGGRPKAQSVTLKTWGATKWAWTSTLQGGQMGGWAMTSQAGQDRAFVKDLEHTAKELIKAGGGE